MKIFNGLLVFSALIVGINCFEWNDLGATIKDEITEEIGDLTAPIVQVKNDLVDLAVLTKTKLSNIEFTKFGQVLASLGSSDACTNLTDDGELAYTTFAKTENFAINVVTEVSADLNDILNCANELLINQVQCLMKNIKIVRQDIVNIQKSLPTYKDMIVRTYKTILSDYKNCLKELF